MARDKGGNNVLPVLIERTSRAEAAEEEEDDNDGHEDTENHNAGQVGVSL